MFNYSLTLIALLSFSVVSNAAAIPTDADQVALGATLNAVLHKEVMLVQGGDFDKDVGEAIASAAMDACQNDGACINTDSPSNASRVHESPSLNSWFAVRDDSGALQPIVVLISIIAGLIVYLSRKSISTK